MSGDIEARFWAKVDKSGECWEWRGATNELRGGYGYFSTAEYGTRRVHRIAYALLIGPVPDGLELDHLCSNRICVNPAHLEPVTHRENVLRSRSHVAARAAQTHCINGHEFTPENTRYRPHRPTSRDCRTCHNERRRTKRAEARAAREAAALPCGCPTDAEIDAAIAANYRPAKPEGDDHA